MPLSVELQSLVDTHDDPFMVIDKSYTIVAVNVAFAQSYKIEPSDVIGKHCYETSHSNSKPCNQMGEDCPYQQVFDFKKVHTCLHVHHDKCNHNHRVRVTAYPLRGRDGELYLGERIQELHTEEDSTENGISMVGVSPVFLRMIEQLLYAAEGNAPVLLQGETGTGKELAASFLHQHSKRKDGPFLTLDCTVLTESLFESEVFGHEKGAFTGNIGKKIGLFELANSGTLFLDEVGELPPIMQAKLLRVLESGEFRRVGGTQTLYADVRIVCATNRDLLYEVKTGNFREDLYYRIACITISTPSLRERPEDISLLIHALLNRINQTRNNRICLTDEALAWLTKYDFPGNIRELRNILHTAVASCHNRHIDLEQLQHVLSPETFSLTSQPFLKSGMQAVKKEELRSQGQQSLVAMEQEQIALFLKQFSGNRKQVAAHLGISVRTLYRKLNKYSIK